MAGEKFIALEETSQQIKASVETVSTSVNEIKTDVGDGAGTDLISRVAQLQAKVDQLLSKGNDISFTDIFLNFNWSKKYRLGQIASGKKYLIYYVPITNINTFTVRNSEGGHCKILINDFVVHDETSRFTYTVAMPFCLFTLEAQNDYGSLLEVSPDKVNLYYKEIK